MWMKGRIVITPSFALTLTRPVLPVNMLGQGQYEYQKDCLELNLVLHFEKHQQEPFSITFPDVVRIVTNKGKADPQCAHVAYFLTAAKVEDDSKSFKYRKG